jgi:hypothetical protein
MYQPYLKSCDSCLDPKIINVNLDESPPGSSNENNLKKELKSAESLPSQLKNATRKMLKKVKRKGEIDYLQSSENYVKPQDVFENLHQKSMRKLECTQKYSSNLILSPKERSKGCLSPLNKKTSLIGKNFVIAPGLGSRKGSAMLHPERMSAKPSYKRSKLQYLSTTERHHSPNGDKFINRSINKNYCTSIRKYNEGKIRERKMKDFIINTYTEEDSKCSPSTYASMKKITSGKKLLRGAKSALDIKTENQYTSNGFKLTDVSPSILQREEFDERILRIEKK